MYCSPRKGNRIIVVLSMLEHFLIILLDPNLIFWGDYAVAVTAHITTLRN